MHSPENILKPELYTLNTINCIVHQNKNKKIKTLVVNTHAHCSSDNQLCWRLNGKGKPSKACFYYTDFIHSNINPVDRESVYPVSETVGLYGQTSATPREKKSADCNGLRGNPGTALAAQTQSIPKRRRRPGPGFPGRLPGGADALVASPHQSRPSTRSVRAQRSRAEGEAARRAGAATRRPAGPSDGADGGLAALPRGRGAQRPLRRGGRKLPLRVGGLRGKGKRRAGRTRAGRPSGPRGRRAPAHAGSGRAPVTARVRSPTASAAPRPPLRRWSLSQPPSGLMPRRRCFHCDSLTPGSWGSSHLHPLHPRHCPKPGFAQHSQLLRDGHL